MLMSLFSGYQRRSFRLQYASLFFYNQYSSDAIVDIKTHSEFAHVCRTPYRRECNVEGDVIDANAPDRVIY